MIIAGVVEPFDGADLSLLAALDALLTERHVTRAAARLGITQSSMSHQLARLRERFGDPLLVRVGREMALTPRAAAMAEPLRAAMAALRRAVSVTAPFDPARTQRAFTLACPDLLAPALPDLLSALQAEAPGMVLHVVGPGPEVRASLADGRCDLALGPTPAEAPGYVMRALGAVRWCVLARRGHPLTRGRFTTAGWSSYPHIVVRQNHREPNRIGAAIEAAGVRRTIGLTVPGFLAVPWVLARTDMVFTAPRELVGEVATALDLAVLDPPVDLPAFPVAALWHERAQSDAGHAWFRERVVKALSARLRLNRRARR